MLLLFKFGKDFFEKTEITAIQTNLYLPESLMTLGQLNLWQLWNHKHSSCPIIFVPLLLLTVKISANLWRYLLIGKINRVN
jgi:hypothetical protein